MVMKQGLLFFLGLAFLCFSPFVVFAQEDGPIAKASLVSELTAIPSEEGSSFFIALRLQLPDQWHLYWRNPGDSGIPPSAEFTAPEALEIGAAHWPKPEVIPYDFLTNYGYSGDSYVLYPVTIDDAITADALTLTAKATWLVCKEICIPESANLSLTLPVASEGSPAEKASAPGIHNAIASLPTIWRHDAVYTRKSVADGDTIYSFELSWPRDQTDPIGVVWESVSDIKVFTHESGVVDHAAPQIWAREGNTVRIDVPAGSVIPSDALDATIAFDGPEGGGSYFFAAFGNTNNAGHLERSDAAERSEISRRPDGLARNDGASDITLLSALLFAFLGGIILNLMPCVLPVLSLKALSLSKCGEKDRRAVRAQGLSYTAGILFSFAIIAGILIALQQAGQAVGWGFQLQEPGFVIALAYIVFAVGLNLSGALEVHTSFGDAGANLTQGTSVRASFFTGMLATLVATPCTAPFMAGALGYAITQPPALALAIFLTLGLGLAFPYLLVSYVPSFQKLLPKPGAWMEGFKQFLAFPMYLTAAWLVWVLALQSGADGVLWALAGMIAIAYLGWSLGRGHGMITRWITLILVAGVVLHSVKQQETLSYTQAMLESIEVEKEAFSEARLNALLREDKPVFVYGTAAWCITCKVNERTTLNTRDVQEAFEENDVTVLRADWTNRNEPIRKYLERFGRNGVPIYVYYAPGEEPVLLPQILTPGIVLEAIED